MILNETDDYAEWTIWMKGELIKKDLWFIITGDEICELLPGDETDKQSPAANPYRILKPSDCVNAYVDSDQTLHRCLTKPRILDEYTYVRKQHNAMAFIVAHVADCYERKTWIHWRYKGLLNQHSARDMWDHLRDHVRLDIENDDEKGYESDSGSEPGA